MPLTIAQNLPAIEQLNNTYLISIDSYSAISLHGEEQSKYLQGQVTCDVNDATQNNLLVGAHCNAKGKVFGVFRLINRDNSHLLIQPNASIKDSLTELTKFGIFAKVTIEQASNLSFYALAGKQASTILQEVFDQVPDSLTPVVHAGSTTIAYIAGKQTRYILIDESNTLNEKLSQLSLTCYSEKVWNLLEIVEGFVQLNQNSSGEYVPQMLNLQAINGISFTKGCYLGQETVARMQYLGKNKRALFSLTTDTETPLSADESIEIKLGDNWRKAGDLLTSYQADNGHCYLQAVLSSELTEQTQLRLKSQPDAQVVIQALPYSLDRE
ncbi:MAG: tRNA-modifying protein YgfZ [Litorilituus sp.]|jgi:hypothetical protein|nr:tRNA-modifying protein YgfZ [Litorilituus sp.]